MRSSLATLTTAAILLACSAVPAYAQETARPTLTLRSIRLAPDPVNAAPALRFDMATGRLPAAMAPRVQERSKARRAMWAAIGGVGGFFGGAYLGAAIEGDRCNCDDPGLLGALIGMPIGAATGAILGWKFGR